MRAVATRPAERELAHLVRQLVAVAALGLVALAVLEQHRLGLAAQVLHEVRQQARQHVAADARDLGRDRVGDAHVLVLERHALLQHGVRRERVVVDLVRADLGRREFAHATHEEQLRLAQRRHDDALQRLLRDVVVAEHAADLLDEVVFDRDVLRRAEARHSDRKAARSLLDAETQRGQDAFDLRLGQHDAELLVDARLAQRDRLRLVAEACGIRQRTRGLRRRAPRLQQAHEVVHRELGIRRVLRLLEASARVGAEAEAHAAATDRRGVEVGGLEEQRRRAARHHRALAAHDARQRLGLVARAHEQVRRFEHALLLVERRDVLTGLRTANVHCATLQVRGVECVHRLAEVEHHEVREVDRQVDRTLPHRGEQHAQLPRRRVGNDTVDAQTAVARARLLVLDADLDLLARGRERDRLAHIAQWTAVDRREFAREAIVAPQVRAVVHRLVVDLEHRVEHGHHIDEARAGLRGVRQHKDAAVVLREAHLALAADHPVRVDAADLGGLDLERALAVDVRQRMARLDHDDLLARGDVRRATDDLHNAARAEVDAAHAELVGVGMTVLLQHVADHE